MDKSAQENLGTAELESQILSQNHSNTAAVPLCSTYQYLSVLRMGRQQIRSDAVGRDPSDSDWAVHNGLVILRENCNLCDGHPGPLAGTNGHSDALDALREGSSQVFSVHLPILEVLNALQSLARITRPLPASPPHLCCNHHHHTAAHLLVNHCTSQHHDSGHFKWLGKEDIEGVSRPRDAPEHSRSGRVSVLCQVGLVLADGGHDIRCWVDMGESSLHQTGKERERE
ncbi:hypothetical protein E2C01_013108 [Portunus trituberculatus]|uniref:Uncharacterized protein n=1 Tax=Portunus trituberculatus TaxID=210409 RepID=A0A5B7DGE7_PORTR|nr:hypothetical protein [Portunus trituberculatus]